MEWAFYIFGLVAIIATIRVISHTQSVYALLYLIISLLAVAGVFFSLGASLAGALEIIIYAGAIMVLFVFVLMMLPMDNNSYCRPPNRQIVTATTLSVLLLFVLLRAFWYVRDEIIIGQIMETKTLGIYLFGPYVLAVELASLLLLAGLVVVFHLGRDERDLRGEISWTRTRSARRNNFR